MGITNIGPTKPEEKQGSSFLEEEVSKETDEEEKTNQEELNTSTKEINVSMMSKSPEKETSAASVHEQEPQSESEETAKEVENENKNNDIMSQNAEEQEKDEENKDTPKVKENDTLAVNDTKEEQNIQVPSNNGSRLSVRSTNRSVHSPNPSVRSNNLSIHSIKVGNKASSRRGSNNDVENKEESRRNSVLSKKDDELVTNGRSPTPSQRSERIIGSKAVSPSTSMNLNDSKSLSPAPVLESEYVSRQSSPTPSS